MDRIYLYIALILLPIATSFITYTFVSVGNSAISLDDNQALILLLALIKMLLLGSTGVFPINLNNVFNSFLEKRKRSTFYKVPKVEKFPCIRRLICEIETAARTSDSYNLEAPANINGRNSTEETSFHEDPITEMQIEAIKALFGTHNESNDLTALDRRALSLVENLTGRSCGLAYKKCPGRITGKKFFKYIFKEMNYEAREEL